MSDKIIVWKEKQYLYLQKKKSLKTVRYDLKENQLQRPHKKGIDKWENVQHQYTFFQDYNMHSLEFKEEKFEKFIWLVRRCNPGCASISTFITRIKEWQHLEGYAYENIEVEIYTDYYDNYARSLKHPLNKYPKQIIQFFKETGITVTMDFEAGYFDSCGFIERCILQLSQSNLDVESKCDAIQLLIGYSSKRNVFSLVDRHKFNFKSLMEYIFNYLQPFEAINSNEALSILNDYYDMASVIGRKVKKYPKYLRSMHDIISANYNAHKKEYDELKFQQMMRKELLYKDREFCIVLPESSKDIVREGTDLNHCVSSYVDKVLQGSTYIAFLRATKKPEQSLVTVEVQDTRVIQAKGSYNRAMTPEEKKFLEKFCKQKKLVYAV